MADFARALVVQHIDYEAPYAIAAALERAGVEPVIWGCWKGEPLPAIDGFDGLVVMGGSPSAYSDDGFPSRRAELALVADAVDRAVPVLGICLGAQLIAHACGGEARKGDAGLEVGWAPVRLLPAAHDDELFSGEPVEFPALHWHGDTFLMPPGAVRLASSAMYENQAFRLGDCVWGVQFHIEIDADGVRSYCGDDDSETEAAAGGGVASIIAATPTALAQVEPIRDRVFDRFAQRVARS